MPAQRPASQVKRAQAFGERVRSLRRARKLTQKALADQLPMSPGHLSRIETGDYGPPGDEVIERLAEVLQTDPLELLRVAGREAGSNTFEARVLAELAAIRSGMEQLQRQVGRK